MNARVTAIDHCPKCGALLVAGKCITCMDDKRILAMTDAEVVAAHLALYGGDRKLARRSIDMMQAKIQAILANHWKQ